MECLKMQARNYIIVDESMDRHIVNGYEGSSQYEPGEYGNSFYHHWSGDKHEAMKIIERLAKETGHRFTIIEDPWE